MPLQMDTNLCPFAEQAFGFRLSGYVFGSVSWERPTLAPQIIARHRTTSRRTAGRRAEFVTELGSSVRTCEAGTSGRIQVAYRIPYLNWPFRMDSLLGSTNPSCYRPKSVNPGCSSGRRPRGQWNFRSTSVILSSLMLACLVCISPSESNSQFSLP